MYTHIHTYIYIYVYIHTHAYVLQFAIPGFLNLTPKTSLHSDASAVLKLLNRDNTSNRTLVKLRSTIPKLFRGSVRGTGMGRKR